MKPKRHRHNISRGQGRDVAQSDLTINLFVSLIVVFAILAASSAITTGFKVAINPDHVEGDPPPIAMVRSWRPVQPVSPRIVIRKGLVQRLDLDQLALGYARGAPFLSDINSTTGDPEDPDPAAFIVDINLGEAMIPPELVAWSIPTRAFTDPEAGDAAASRAAFDRELGVFEQFDLIVFPEQDVAMWHIASLLHSANKRFRVLYARNDAKLVFDRSSRYFTFEEIYK